MATKRISSLHKGLQILSCFSPENETLTAKEIAQSLSVPISTLYRYLDTLIENGFLIKNKASNSYHLGYMLLHLGNVMSQSIGFVEIIRPRVSDLSMRLDETVMLMARSGERAACLYLKETSKPIRLNMQIGTVLPLYAGASSKVLLAYQSKNFIDDYLRRVPLDRVAPNTITSKRELLANLERIRDQGYSVADQEVNPGVAGIASPVFNTTGDIVASIVVAGPSDRLLRKQEELVSAAVESAREASWDLGFKNEKNTKHSQKGEM